MRFVLPLFATVLLAGCQSQPFSSDATSIVLSPELHCEADTIADLPPLDELLVSDPSLHDDLFDRLRQGFALDLTVDNRDVRAQRAWYAANQDYLDRVFARSERYLHYMLAEAEKRNIPTEIVLLPVVESAFDPFAYSHGRASGPWQFIPSTGKLFGLDQNYWYDGRRDIIESTRAAYDYLTRLHDSFDGDWLLALASYNTGAGNVRKAIRRNEAAGKPTDFWHLKLHRETSAYVPKLLAIAQIVANPEKYGVTLQPIANYPQFEVVDIGSQIDLGQAAELAEMSLNELYLFNPGFNQWSTSPEGPHRLLIPAERAELFAARLSEVPAESRVKWTTYHVRKGDSLTSIAKRFHTTSDRLRDVNELRSSTLSIGQTLLIPSPFSDTRDYHLSQENRRERILSKGPDGKIKKVITVGKGDTLWSIANEHNIATRALAKWNAMAPTDPLRIGQEVVIWLDPTPEIERAIEQANERLVSTASMVRNITYRVRRGDTLSNIATRFNVSIDQICQWNNISPSRYLYPGQKLKLVVDVRETYR